MNWMKYLYFVLLLPAFLLLACDKEASVEFGTYEPKIVVEGSIENGRYASVLLSESASMNGPKDTASLLNQVIRSAKVTVSDGENSEILILTVNKSKIPPYEYAGTQIRGEAGKTYYLTIECRGKTITAQTYIPKPVPLENISFRKEAGKDSIGYIYINFRNTSDDYYRVSTQDMSTQTSLVPCLYGNMDNKFYPKDELISIQINKGPTIFPYTDFRTYFMTGSMMRIKFSTQPKAAYDFWNSYQNEVLNAQNPIFPANESLKSNINGGIGIWSGYGSYTYYKILE